MTYIDGVLVGFVGGVIIIALLCYVVVIHGIKFKYRGYWRKIPCILKDVIE